MIFDIRKMNERYYIVADSVKDGGFTPSFLEKLAEVVKEEVLVQRRLLEAFQMLPKQRQGKRDGEGKRINRLALWIKRLVHIGDTSKGMNR